MYLDLMAHDINNLNQVAIGNLELAIDEMQQEKPEEQEILDFLQKSLDTMCQQTSLIKNVKTLQRLKTEQKRNEEIDLGEMIAEAVREYHNVPGREVTIEYESPGKCFVSANRLLKEVFVNLIGNSVKHSKGPVRIWITVDSTLEKGKKYYEVAVADDGPGIPDDMKEHLFRRFKTEGGESHRPRPGALPGEDHRRGFRGQGPRRGPGARRLLERARSSWFCFLLPRDRMFIFKFEPLLM